MRRSVSLAIALTACASLTACGSSSSSARPSSPKEWRAAMVAAALAQGSVHWTRFIAVPMIEWRRTSADVTTDGGVERILLRPWCKAEIRLVNDVVYERGDSRCLGYTLRLANTKAARYAGRWISIPKGDKLYSGAADGLTLTSILHDVTPRGEHLVTQTTADGPTGLLGPTGPGGPTGAARSAESLGTLAPTLLTAGPTGQTLSLRTGEPLPVVYTDFCVICVDIGTFSRWGEPVHVQAPANSTPIATVRRG
ncbi:MAG: hypothetical protein QOG85_709 [Gaiellaceae bacterium]|nr:hypothetical protein [Gaiellaceae bacterium]